MPAVFTVSKEKIDAAQVMSCDSAPAAVWPPCPCCLTLLLHLWQVCQLWSAAGLREASPERTAHALEQTFAVAGAFAPEPAAASGAAPAQRRLIGVARQAASSALHRVSGSLPDSG